MATVALSGIITPTNVVTATSTTTLTNKTLTGAVVNGTVGATTPSTGAFTTVTTTGNVGVGTASPSVRLQVEGTTDATQRIVVNGSGNYSSLKLQYNATEVAQFQNYQSSEVSIGATSNAFLALVTNNTERARIPAAGGIQSKTTISVGDATPSSSGAGITFPATASDSTSANTLDDYEEGTWTPTPTNLTVIGTPTYTGIYTKIGRQVTYNFSVTSTTSTSSTANSTNFSGLPFTIAMSAAGSVTNDNVASVGQCLAYAPQATKIFTPTWTASGATFSLTGIYNV